MRLQTDFVTGRIQADICRSFYSWGSLIPLQPSWEKERGVNLTAGCQAYIQVRLSVSRPMSQSSEHHTIAKLRNIHRPSPSLNKFFYSEWQFSEVKITPLGPEQ